MLKNEDYAAIKTLKQRGIYLNDIAEGLWWDTQTAEQPGKSEMEWFLIPLTNSH
ncbi:MAG: hypothetical protein WBD56_12345 [Anaerolineales bacterium]